MEPSSPFGTPLVRCSACGNHPERGQPLRRGRCQGCYDTWVKARPIGIGASCAACTDHRRSHLRHYEIGLRGHAPGGRWVVLCHNCVAVADELDPPPRSIEALKMRLARDRRWGDRRAAAVGRPSFRAPWLERRQDERRDLSRGIFDATDAAEEILEQVIELEADYEIEVAEDQISDEPVTGIHFRLPAE